MKAYCLDKSKRICPVSPTRPTAKPSASIGGEGFLSNTEIPVSTKGMLKLWLVPPPRTLFVTIAYIPIRIATFCARMKKASP